MSETTTNVAGGSDSARPGADRRFGRWLLVILAAAAAMRGAIVADQRANNLFYNYPQNDGEVYWEWSGRIAGGEWVGSEPFLSAPLYPYVVALVRLAGGGLTHLFVLQIAMQLAAATLLAISVRARFGASAGLWAAALFLLMADPAAHVCRVLNNSLQLLLICLLWWLMVRLEAGPTWGRCAVVGAVLGLNCLATPPMVLALLAAGPWLVLAWRDRRRAVGGAAVMLATAAIVISPATWHNYRACGEFIPIQAGSGVAFRFGNQPGGEGTFQPLAGFFGNRERLHIEAAEQYEKKTGAVPTWKAVDDFFYREALDALRADPRGALTVWRRKLWWFLSGHYYDDIAPSFLEIKSGFARALQLAPVPAAWVMLPAMVILAALARRPVRYGPELLLFAVPLVVVVAFQYTPRYRMPALPVACGVVAWGLSGVLDRSLRGRRLLALGAATAVGVVAGPFNVATGFDNPARYEPLWFHHVGSQYEKLGRQEEAERYLVLAAKAWPEFWAFHTHLGEFYRRTGRPDKGLAELREGARLGPREPVALRAYAAALEGREDDDHLLRVTSRLAEVEGTVEEYLALGNLLAGRGELGKAVEQFRRAVGVDPGQVEARLRLHTALAASGRFAEARANLEEAVGGGMREAVVQNALAWLLATCPDDSVRDGPAALRAAREAIAEHGAETAWLLDTQAAAHAECGEFDEAVRVAGRALELARAANDTALAGEIEARLREYRSHRPHRAAAPTTAPAGAAGG